MGLFPDESIAPSTWADGFGIWHAAVPVTGNARADVATARRLIKDELVARSAPDATPVFRIKVKYRVDDIRVYCEAT
jgi:hypothetical protein